MIKYLYVIILVSISISSSYGQAVEEIEDNPYKYKREVFIDATAVLGNLLSLNSERARSPYGFGFRFHREKYAIRVSGNTFYDNDDQFEFDGIDFINRRITEHRHSIRIGYEKKKVIAKNFSMLYGFDALAGYELTDSELSKSFSRIDQNISLGFGPALRIEYRINDRFSLMTESTFYGKLIFNTDTFSLNGDPPQTVTGINYQLNLALPNALIFSIGF